MDKFSTIESKIVKDRKLSKDEKQAFKDYLREKVLIDWKVEIEELTKWKLRYFVNDEWGKFNEKQLLWKGWVKRLQQVLWVDDDWHFWTDTLKALLEFQIELSLKPDWIIWDKTIEKLNENWLNEGFNDRIEEEFIYEEVVEKQEEEPKVEETKKWIIDDIEIWDNEVLKVFKKTRKWQLFLRLIKDYSPISVEKLSELILKSANTFDIPFDRVASVIIWEADVSIKKSPFKVNSKWVWQFLTQTFKDLYSKVKWDDGIAITWNVLQYLKYKKYTKYANSVKAIWINSLSDRKDPEKSIMAIWAYLRYIMISWKWINWNIHLAVARYNVWPNWSVSNHFDNNPVIKEYFQKLYGKDAKITEDKMVHAAAEYYAQFT